MTTTDIALLGVTGATALFTGWAVWQRWRYTPRPLWTQPSDAQLSEYWFNRKQGAHASWRIENRGDAAAHDVRVFLVEPGGASREESRLGRSIVNPGESVNAAIDLGEVTGEYSYDVETDESTDSRVYRWSPRHVELRWRQHPNLKRVKRQRWPLPPPGSGVS